MLQLLLEPLEQVRSLLERGGDVLLWIFVVTGLMWMLIIERYWQITRAYPPMAKEAFARWTSRSDHSSWYAKSIRTMELARLSESMRITLPIIGTLIAVCPLLGLLGTVTGMIEVFDVMALLGGGNTKAMAAGVSKATIPTMAGMVAALSGMYFRATLERMAEKRQSVAEQSMRLH